MKDFLIIYVLYSVYASVTLVLSMFLDDRHDLVPHVSRGRIEYIGISNGSILKWAAQYSNFVIFDIHDDLGIGDWEEDLASRCLPISIIELPNLLRWIPPASRVVFCCKDATRCLDSKTKTTLLQLGIGTVYFLSNGTASRRNLASLKPGKLCWPKKCGKEQWERRGGVYDVSQEVIVMKQLLLVALISLSKGLFAQSMIPDGTILPVQLNASIRSDRARAGEHLSARVMQDVPLPGGGKIHSGAKVIGHVVSSKPAGNGTGGEISLRFDTLTIRKHHIAITTNLRALATMMDVSEAQVPESGPDRGTPENWWTTDQIGGEVDYHSAVVEHGSTAVGNSAPDSGVLVHISSRPGMKCRGEMTNNHQLQALWVFSSDACGLYDFQNLSLMHAGRTDPVGQITLFSTKNNVKVPAGSGILLRIEKSTPLGLRPAQAADLGGLGHDQKNTQAAIKVGL